jgi:zinc transporter 7
MGSQFFTAVGAFVGTFLGIWIAETSGTGKGVVLKEGQGFFGSSVAGGDLVIPMTAGGVSSLCWSHELMSRFPVHCQC